MKQKLWTLTFVLALRKARWDFFQGGTEGDGTLETQRQVPTPIHFATPQSLVNVSLECFPRDPVEQPACHWQQYLSIVSSPPVCGVLLKRP